ncbi:MAG: Bug family tripartite tricarboxylate transporter substrate binding protein [Pseudolabrys sp.]
MLRRRTFQFALAGLAVAAMLATGTRAKADAYPSNKITLVVAFAAGGVADTVGRLIGQGLSERLKQNIVVENRGGASGNIAAQAVARAQPDGYTLLVTTTALAINETLRENKGFAAADLRAVAVSASSPESLLTSNDNAAANLADLVKNAKGIPINFGSAGVGSGSHIAAEYFFREIAKVEATHVPFQGGAPALNATLGNQIDVLATTLGGAPAAQINAGKLKGLGITAEKRAGVVPGVPTFAEQGYPGFFAASWVGVFAPAKTDPAIIATLNAAINETIRSPAVQQRLTAIGFDPIAISQADADALFKGEVEKWGKMVKTLKLSVK